MIHYMWFVNILKPAADCLIPNVIAILIYTGFEGFCFLGTLLSIDHEAWDHPLRQRIYHENKVIFFFKE